MQRFGLALVVTALIATPALAGDEAPQRCTLFCKLWRNVSGRVQRPVTASSWDDGAMRAPTIEEESRTPRAADLVTVHGEIIRKSRAERQREQAAMADDVKRIEALRAGGAETEQAGQSATPPKVGRAD